MYARVLWGKVKMGMWDELQRYYEEKVAPSTESMKYFLERSHAVQ